MLWNDPSRVGDPRPVDGVKSFRPLDLLARVPSWVFIVVFCLVVPVLLAVSGYLWLMQPQVELTRGAPITARPDDQWAARVAPKVFPPWIEVPYLDGPLRRENDTRPPRTDSSGGAPHAFPEPGVGRTVPIASLPSRPDPRSPSFEQAPSFIDRVSLQAMWVVEGIVKCGTAMEVATLPPNDVAIVEPAIVTRAWSPASPTRPRPRAQPAMGVDHLAGPRIDPDQTASVILQLRIVG